MSHRIASHYTAQYRDHNFPVTIPFTGMDRPFTIGIVGKVLVCLLMISWYLVCLVYLIFQFLSFLSWLALWCYRVVYHIASSQHIVWYCIVEPLQLDCNHSTGGVKEWWITHNLEHVCVYIYIPGTRIQNLRVRVWTYLLKWILCGLCQNKKGWGSQFPRDNKARGCMTISKLTKTRRGRDLDLKKKLGLGCKDPQEQTSSALETEVRA